MTLDTRIYVHDKVDVFDAFHHFRSLLGATDAHPWRSDAGCVSNHCGVGLPAWLMIYHAGNDTPLRVDGDACDEYCDRESDDPDDHYHKPAMWCEISFDTAYGYRDESGRGCGDLHACYIAEMGKWLDDRGVPWSWKNEYDAALADGAPF